MKLSSKNIQGIPLPKTTLCSLFFLYIFQYKMIKELTKWKITKTLIMFAIPILIWNLIQQIYNIADTIIVWRFISDTALASVWAAFPIFFLLISIPIWLAAWASVIMSQLFGAKRLKDVKKSAYTALISAWILWLITSIIWFCFCWPILNLLQTPSDIFAWSKLYLQVIFLWTTLLFVYDMATSTFNALWDSKTPLQFLIISAVVNICLDLLFVIKFHRWIAWAAWATVVSRTIATTLAVVVLLRRLKKLESEKLENIFDWELLHDMTKIAIPAMLNHSLVAVWALAVQAVINSFGSNVIAGFTAASKVDTLAMMPIMNLSFALATFVAQNLWAKELQRAKAWFRSALTISVIFGLVMAIIIFFFGSSFIKIFLDTWVNPEIIEFGKNYLMVVSFGYILMWFLFDSWAVLRASGTMRPFVTSTLISIWAKVAAAYLLAWILWSSVIWWSVIIWRWMWAIISMWAYLKWNWQNTNLVDDTKITEIEMEWEEEKDHLD